MNIVGKNPKVAKGGFAKNLSDVTFEIVCDQSRKMKFVCEATGFVELMQKLNELLRAVQTQSKSIGIGVPVVASLAADAEAELAPETGNIFVGFQPTAGSICSHSINPALARKLAAQLIAAAQLAEASDRPSRH